MTAPTPTLDPAAVLARWREVEQAATEGPWVEHYGDVRTAHTPATSKRPERQSVYLAEWVVDADAVFAATARTAFPALLAAVEAVLALVDAAEGAPLRDLHRDVEGDPFPAEVTTDAIRAAIATAIGGAR